MNGRLAVRDYDKGLMGSTLPEVEVIVPTLNENSAIKEMIHDFRRLNIILPVHISILVVDGCSTDKTLQICKEEKIRFIVQTVKGKGAAVRHQYRACNTN